MYLVTADRDRWPSERDDGDLQLGSYRAVSALPHVSAQSLRFVYTNYILYLPTYSVKLIPNAANEYSVII